MYSVFLFLLSVLISLVTTWNATGNFLDSDASSELILAHHLSQTGKILSPDWIYSTELRVLNTQLVYAPLFLLFHDWHMVRFGGALILQAILLLTYGFLSKETGSGKRSFFLGSAILLLPVSVAYGRIVLYHCYYIPHISLSFLLLGLTLKYTELRSWKCLRSYIPLAMILILSFIGGLGGIRQLMISHAPTLVCIVVFCFMEDLKDGDARKASVFSPQKLQLLLCSGFAAFASVLGFLYNDIVLSKQYHFASFAKTRLGILNIGLDEVLYGFLHQFGFRDGVPLLSVFGILSIGGIVAAGYCIFISTQKLLRYKKGSDLKKAIVQSYFLYYTVIMLGVFLLTGKYGEYYYVLYLTLCLPWAVPALLGHLEDFSPEIHIFNVRRIFSWVSAVVLLLNGFVNAAYFCGVERFKQDYEGLVWQEADYKEDLTGVTTFLLENGYHLGYSTFWQGNVMTEMTDGEILAINVEYDYDQERIILSDWLTLSSLREVPIEKPFLVISQSLRDSFGRTEAARFCTQVYEDDVVCVYDISDRHSFSQLLQ